MRMKPALLASISLLALACICNPLSQIATDTGTAPSSDDGANSDLVSVIENEHFTIIQLHAVGISLESLLPLYAEAAIAQGRKPFHRVPRKADGCLVVLPELPTEAFGGCLAVVRIGFGNPPPELAGLGQSRLLLGLESVPAVEHPAISLGEGLQRPGMVAQGGDIAEFLR